MADIVKPEVRSRMMSRIRRRDTKPEISLRRALHRKGYRFRTDYRKLPGSPDIVFPKWKTALFVHGCYWHRHPGCRKATIPSTNTEFWNDKFRQNVERDERNIGRLLDAGWHVGIVWECAIGKQPSSDLVDRIIAFIVQDHDTCIIFED